MHYPLENEGKILYIEYGWAPKFTNKYSTHIHAHKLLRWFQIIDLKRKLSKSHKPKHQVGAGQEIYAQKKFFFFFG